MTVIMSSSRGVVSQYPGKRALIGPSVTTGHRYVTKLQIITLSMTMCASIRPEQIEITYCHTISVTYLETLERLFK